MICSNCESEGTDVNGLFVRAGKDGAVVAHLCSTCVHEVLTLKIVLSRSKSTESFAFSGYLPVASAR